MLLNHRINQRLHFFTQNADPSGYVTPEPLEEEPSREDILQNLLLGTPEECLDKVEEYYRLGVDQLMLYFDFGPAHEEVLGAMEVFAREVMDPFAPATIWNGNGPSLRSPPLRVRDVPHRLWSKPPAMADHA